MKTIDEENNNGFSLLELILALALGAVILAVLINSFIAQRINYDYQEQQVEMVQTARAALDMITGELTMAGYDSQGMLQWKTPTDIDFSGVVYHAPATKTLEFRADLNNDGDVATGSGTDPEAWAYDTNERITYKLIGDQLKRRTGTGDFEPFAENVEDFVLTYYTGSLTNPDETTTDSGKIRKVGIIITLKTEKVVANKGEDETEAAAVIKIRNIGLAKRVIESGSSTTTTSISTTSTSSTSSTSTVSTSSTSITSTSSTSTSSTSSTSTSSTTSTTRPNIEYQDECDDGTTIGINLDACTETFNDYLLIRVYIEKDGEPYEDALVTWWIEDDAGNLGYGTPTILTQVTGKPAWYGGSTACGCGTYTLGFSCGKSSLKYKVYHLTVRVQLADVDGGCVIDFTESNG